MRSGAKLVVRTVKLISTGKARVVNQNEFLKKDEIVRKAPKIYSKDCFIDWSLKTEEIHNFIRGLSPYPGARSLFEVGGNKTLIKILEARPHKSISQNKGSISISSTDGSLELIKIQPEGKRVMLTEEYLRGVGPDSIKLIKDPLV